ncbi:MAG: hypothetical protein CBD02_04675 [Candidatus Pelagibacter sp. TMED142]|nr:MAG: hypothetical protein CBD02_04675 [Candidatus Pelagibacter sp. TMED142]
MSRKCQRLLNLFDVQGSHGVGGKDDEASGFVLIPCLDDTSLTRTHRLAKVEGDAEGFDGQVWCAKHFAFSFLYI